MVVFIKFINRIGILTSSLATNSATVALRVARWKFSFAKSLIQPDTEELSVPRKPRSSGKLRVCYGKSSCGSVSKPCTPGEHQNSW